jgi:hypothetical protein
MSKLGEREPHIASSIVASPYKIEQHLAMLHDEMDDAVAVLKILGEKAAKAKAELENQHAKAMLRARTQDDLTAAPDRKAWADVEVADARMEHTVLESLHSSQKAVLKVQESQAMILMALLRSVRVALGEN